jgi:hypothetical protein
MASEGACPATGDNALRTSKRRRPPEHFERFILYTILLSST